jgi:hypothetical protein
MSSVTSQMAQIGRRINYFISVADVSGLAGAAIVAGSDSNSWTYATGYSATTLVQIATAAGTILQDMGEMAKLNGQVLRKVRLIDNQAEATGNTSSVVYWIVVPGGEYPIQGYPNGLATPLPVAKVARLG